MKAEIGFGLLNLMSPKAYFSKDPIIVSMSCGLSRIFFIVFIVNRIAANDWGIAEGGDF